MSKLSENIRTWRDHGSDLKPHRVDSLADRAEELEAELDRLREQIAKMKEASLPVVTHLSMDPNASEETKRAVGEVVLAAYAYKHDLPKDLEPL